LENSGVLVTGKSILHAFDRLEVLEATADAFINALTLGLVHPMSPEAILDLEKEFLS
jgi:L-fuculose-phosphate aldolase